MAPRSWILPLAAFGLLAAVLFWFDQRATSPAEPRAATAPIDAATPPAAPPVSVGAAGAAGGPARRREVDVSPGEAPTGAEPDAGHELELRGRVVDPLERPVAGARVELRRNGRQGYGLLDAENFRGSRAARRPTCADDDGTFLVEGLAAGPYTITAYPSPSAEDKDHGRSFASSKTRSAPGRRTWRSCCDPRTTEAPGSAATPQATS